MKIQSHYLAFLLGTVLLSGCGGDAILSSANDTNTLVPETEEVYDVNGPQPPQTAAVLTTDQKKIYDVTGEPVLLRGVNLLYGDNPEVRIDGVDGIADLGSNVVRLQLTEATTADQLRTALDRVVENNLIAVVSLVDGERLACSDDDSFLTAAVGSLWLDRWLPVLAERQYQAHMMFNVASQWGPMNVWNANSVGYEDFLATYKVIIRRFRDAGFRLPLVIDAPHCGQDFNAFLGGRARELKAADVLSNLVLSVHAYGSRWNSTSEILGAMDKLSTEEVPYIVSEFGGSQVDGDASVDHMDLMTQSLGSKALIFRMPWESTGDKAGYSYTFDSPVDFEGAGISYDLYVPGEYKSDGNMAVQIFLLDSDSRYAALGFQNVGNFPGNTWTTVALDVTSLDDFGYVTEGFNLNSVAQIGFEISANGKSPEIVADLKFDNFIVGVDSTGSSAGNAIYEATFESNESWVHIYGVGSNSDLSQQSGALALLPPYSDTADNLLLGYQGGNSLNPPVNFREPMNLSVDVFVPEEYATETGMYIQYYFSDSSYGGFAGIGYFPASALNFGGWTTLSYEVADFVSQAGYISSGFDLDSPSPQFGLQIGGIKSAKTEPVLVDNYRISPPASAAEQVTLYEAAFDFDEYWTGGYGAVDENTVTQGNGELYVRGPWDSTTGDPNDTKTAVVYAQAASLNPGIDLTKPLTISVDVFVPEEYAVETTMVMQFIFSDNAWTGFAGFGYHQIKDLNYGEWNTVTVAISDFAADAGYISPGFILDKRPQSFGLEFTNINSAKTEAIRLDNFRITSVSTLVPSNIVVDLTFETQDDADKIALSYVGGDVWMESSLVDAKFLDFGVDPFGWIASVWTGAPEGRELLNISNLEDMVDLTPRGDDIVDSEVGIFATSVLASFGSE